MRFTEFINTLKLDVAPWEHEPETSARLNVYNRDGDLLIADALLDRDHVPNSDTWLDLRDREILDICVSCESEFRENIVDRRKSPVEYFYSVVSVRIDMRGALI